MFRKLRDNGLCSIDWRREQDTSYTYDPRSMFELWSEDDAFRLGRLWISEW